MEIGKAIDRLEMHQSMMLFDALTGESDSLEELKNNDIDEYYLYLAEEEAVKFLKKQLPRKIVSGVAFNECPSCETTTIEYYDCYCRVCGQRLKW